MKITDELREIGTRVSNRDADTLNQAISYIDWLNGRLDDLVARANKLEERLLDYGYDVND